MDYNYAEDQYSYDEYGNIVDNNSLVPYDGIPEGHVHDAFGRLLKPEHEIVRDDYPEDIIIQNGLVLVFKNCLARSETYSNAKTFRYI